MEDAPTLQGQSLNHWPTRAILMQKISSQNENPATILPMKPLYFLLHLKYPQASFRFLTQWFPSGVLGPLHLTDLSDYWLQWGE